VPADPPEAIWLEAPPPNSSFRAGTRLRLACHARGGHPAPRLKWTKDGRALPEGLGGAGAEAGGPLVTRELLLTLGPADNGATYACRHGGGGAGAGASPRLTVL
ncbi:NPHN protein, partial [Alcedo cyanopectus]|nr:NPHN protein [Ceyx cyanopectus]